MTTAAQPNLFEKTERERREGVCSECGAKVREYRQHLSKPLVAGLVALYRVGGESKLEALNLTLSQSNNFQKLRYWELVEKGKSGVWTITRKGLAFVEGRALIQKVVRTFRGKREAYEGPYVSIGDLSEIRYRQRGDYVEDAVVHQENSI
ncbi:MAG TPA: hypothetical protein VJS44_08235 [Pyrinomonadaceae bacterium]|nr:hypothetical protein [Pyrinomonadaceae bacterium]